MPSTRLTPCRSSSFPHSAAGRPSPRRAWALATVLAIVGSQGALAEASASTPATGGVCHETPIPRVDSLPAPTLYAGVGQSAMAVSTDSPEAQAFFNQGLRMLHSFWSFEAYRAFKRAAELDPDLAMAYWGIYRCIGQNDAFESIKLDALAKIDELKDSVTEHERLYLKMVEIAEETEDYDEQNTQMRQQWETILYRFPDDTEAKLFLALSLPAGYDDDDRPVEDNLYRRMLLRDVLRSHPDHATAHHYWIHTVEFSPRPEEGLESAKVLAGLAPEASHLVHMPGHIYFRLGDYNRAYAAFRQGWELDHRYLDDQGIRPVDHWNYVHNVGFLIAASAESGRYRDGLAYAREIVAASLEDGPTTGGGNWAVLYQGWGAMIDLHLRFGKYAAAERELDAMARENLLESEYAEHWIEAQTHYARARGALDRGDLVAARAAAISFDARLWREPGTQSDAADHGHGDTDSDDNPEDEREDPLRATYEMRRFEVLSLELRGLLALADGQRDEALDWLGQAVEKETEQGLAEGDPPSMWRSAMETLAEVYLETDASKAAAVYEDLLEARPGSGFALYGLAKSRSLAGDPAGASEAYASFLDAWRDADSDRPEIGEAHRWLAANDTRETSTTVASR